ncbi:flavin reductase family protein [Mesorhizobium sp. 1B3]|uniref:flavin reductase family protein n=1 Tax=Mesorhizobium sp. 1B3 TaxID=3243599 RepID=UPI003D9631D2
MDLISEELTTEQIYRLMTGLIVPRPIAWVTTLSPAGKVNLAPFSAFTFLSTQPPMIGISIAQRQGGPKDTARNIDANGEFVVNIPTEDLAGFVHGSSRELPGDISETELLGIGVAPSRAVSVPRLAIVPAAMECRLERTIEFGDLRALLVVGRILRFHVRDDLLGDGKIPTDRLRPLARIAGPRYAKIGEILEMMPLHEGSRICEGAK